MKLFHLNEDYEVVPEQETIMLVPEFAALWTLAYNKREGDRDGRKRYRARKELLYLYFFCDYRSEYSELSISERHEAAMDSADLFADYKVSEQLQAAMDKYFAIQETRELKLLGSAYGVIDRLRAYFDEVLITDSNAKGVVDNISKMGGILAGLKKLEEQVRKQHAQDGKIRGSGEKGFLDN